MQSKLAAATETNERGRLLTGGLKGLLCENGVPARSMYFRVLVKIKAIVANILQFLKSLLVVDTAASELDICFASSTAGDLGASAKRKCQCKDEER